MSEILEKYQNELKGLEEHLQEPFRKEGFKFNLADKSYKPLSKTKLLGSYLFCVYHNNYPFVHSQGGVIFDYEIELLKHKGEAFGFNYKLKDKKIFENYEVAKEEFLKRKR